MSSKVILALSPKFLASTVGSPGAMDVSDDNEELHILGPPTCRKRRLDHLTWEEKLQRKKLKNRVAAQTSRDRKKAKMEEMESRMNQLEKENAKLQNEMKSLRELNQRLNSENGQLRKQLSRPAVREVAGADPIGSAESRPLPKEGSAPTASRADPSVTLCHLAMLLLLSKISSRESTPRNTSIALNSLPTVYSEKLMRKIKDQIATNPKIMSGLKWWGPQQNTWNPLELKV